MSLLLFKRGENFIGSAPSMHVEISMNGRFVWIRRKLEVEKNTFHCLYRVQFFIKVLDILRASITNEAKAESYRAFVIAFRVKYWQWVKIILMSSFLLQLAVQSRSAGHLYKNVCCSTW